MRIIRGKYGRRRFDVPTNISARPTTDFARENIFNVLENYVDLEGLTALDLFAGTGAISFEFLSRGCSQVVAVEKARTQISFIKKVQQLLNCNNDLVVTKCDVLTYLDGNGPEFDIIFADPPYDMPGFGDIPGKILTSRKVKPDTIVIVEHSSKFDFSHMPEFVEHRAYGSVNFTIFKSVAAAAPATSDETATTPSEP